MGRFLKQCDREHMKMAMLKHEETFKEQVNELHRLYRVQKMLMRDMKRNDQKRRQISEYQKSSPERWNVENRRVSLSHQACYSYQDQRRPRRTLDLERPAEEYIEDGVMLDQVEQESEIELTLATGSRRKKKEDVSFTSDSGACSFSSSSTESGGENLKLQEWRLFQMQDMNASFSGEGKNGFDLEEQPMRQDRLKQPPWLFQCLSMNMT